MVHRYFVSMVVQPVWYKSTLLIRKLNRALIETWVNGKNSITLTKEFFHKHLNRRHVFINRVLLFESKFCTKNQNLPKWNCINRPLRKFLHPEQHCLKPGLYCSPGFYHLFFVLFQPVNKASTFYQKYYSLGLWSKLM